MLVSHDFRLIGQVAKELWEVKDKKVVKLSISITEYKNTLVRESAAAIENAKKIGKGSK